MKDWEYEKRKQRLQPTFLSKKDVHSLSTWSDKIAYHSGNWWPNKHCIETTSRPTTEKNENTKKKKTNAFNPLSGQKYAFVDSLSPFFPRSVFVRVAYLEGKMTEGVWMGRRAEESKRWRDGLKWLNLGVDGGLEKGGGRSGFSVV